MMIRTKGMYPLIVLLFFQIIMAAQPDPSSSVNQLDAKGRKQGPWMKTDSLGNKVYEGRFIDDKPAGVFTYYYPEGTVRSILKYDDGGGSAYMVNYYQNGKKMAEGTYFNKKKDGSWKYYNDLEELNAEEQYKNGIPQGTWKKYYERLTIMEELPYVAGKKSGKWKQYYPAGNLKSEGTYVNDILEGKASFYYTDGSVMLRGEYEHGLKEGKWESLNPDGSRICTQVFSRGSLVEETWYDKSKQKQLEEGIVEPQ